MPLPLAALVALSLGALLAHVARVELSQADGGLLWSRPLAVVTAFAALVYLPAITYFTVFHGDWAYMYLTAWRRVPSAIDLALVVACAALIPAGFVFVAPFSRARRRNIVVAMIATPAAFAVVLALVLERRLTTNATFVQFSNNFDTHPVAASGLGRAMLLTIAACAAGSLWCVRLLRASRTDKTSKR